MQRKYVGALVVLSLCFIFLFAWYLSSSNQESTIQVIEATTQKQKISLITSWGAYDSKSERLKEVLEKISEKYSNIEIEDSSMAGEDFLFILKTDFASGNPPNIFGLWPGSDFKMLVEQGKVADLTDILKEDTEWYNSFKPDTWKDVTIDGRIYGLPVELIYEGLFINRDLFEKYDVKVPETYEELVEAVKVFKANDIIPIAYNETPEGSYIYQNIVMKLGGKEDVEAPFDEQGNLKPCFIKGMTYMKELYDLGAFPKDLYSIDDKKRNDLFINKEAAMIVQGSWFVGDNALNANDSSVEIIPFPDFKEGKADSTAIIYGCGNGIFHMSQKAWEDETLRPICIDILKELTSTECISCFDKDSGFISNVKLNTTKSTRQKMVNKGRRLVADSKEKVEPVDSFINRSVWEDVIIKEFPKVLQGRMTPEELNTKVRQAMK